MTYYERQQELNNGRPKGKTVFQELEEQLIEERKWKYRLIKNKVERGELPVTELLEFEYWKF